MGNFVYVEPGLSKKKVEGWFGTITMFQLSGTKWICECRPYPRDIVIWDGERIAEVIFGATAGERLRKAIAWMEEHVPEYADDKMVRIQ